jgi:hypothetical protein
MAEQKTLAYCTPGTPPNRHLLTPCAPEKIARGHIECALDRSVQLFDRHGTLFLPVFGYLHQALAALDEFERTAQRAHSEQDE